MDCFLFKRDGVAAPPGIIWVKKYNCLGAQVLAGADMPLFGPTHYCPNAECEYEKALKKGEKCPVCGTEAKPFGMIEGAALFATKKTAKKAAAEGTTGAKAAGKGGYYCPNPACANVKEMRQGEKCPACGTEAQSDDPPASRSPEVGAQSPAVSLTDEEMEEMVRLGMERLRAMGKPATGQEASALFEQNNIIIMQNELILRHLRKR